MWCLLISVFRCGRGAPRPTKPRAVLDEAPLPQSALQTAARHIVGQGCATSPGEGIRVRSGEGGALRVDTPRRTRTAGDEHLR